MRTGSYHTAPPPRASRRIQPDPGRSRGWTSERTWRWLLPSERARVEAGGFYLNPLEPPGRPRGRAVSARDAALDGRPGVAS